MTAATAEAQEVCADREPFRSHSIQRPGVGSMLRLARWKDSGSEMGLKPGHDMIRERHTHKPSGFTMETALSMAFFLKRQTFG